MLCPGYDLFLMILVQINEIVAVTCNTHKQVAIRLWSRLCLAECISVDHVKLNMMAIEPEICTKEMGEFIYALFTVKDAWKESLVQ